MRIDLSTITSDPWVASVKVSELDDLDAPLAFSHSFSILELYRDRPVSPFNHSPEEAAKYTFKAIRDYGKKLFKALFHSDPTILSQKLWRSLPKHSGRILLTTNSNDLNFNLDDIPWEYAYAIDAPLVEKHNFVRVAPHRHQAELHPKPLLHLVIVAPDPIIPPILSDSIELSPLYLDQQYMNFIDKFKIGMKALTLERAFPATLGSIKAMVRKKDSSNRVLHFMGHCRTNDDSLALLFEKEEGSVHYVNSQMLAAIGSFRLIFLAGCHTYKLARALIEEGTTYAIGTYCDIPDFLIRQFEISFYQELSRGDSVEAAFRRAHISDDCYSEVTKSKFTGAMILCSATYQERDGEFECRYGKPIIKENFPTTNLTINHKAQFWGRKKDLLRLIAALRNISTCASQKYRVHTVQGDPGQGKTTLITQAVYRTASTFPGGIYIRSFEKMPKAAEYFKELARVLFVNRKDLLNEILEHSDNEIDRLRDVVTKTLKSHQAEGTCLLILDHAETLKYRAEKTHKDLDLEAVILWNWLHETASVTNGVVVLATSSIYLGWIGESRQELKGMTDDENIQFATNLFSQWIEPRKWEEISQVSNNNKLLQELVKAVKGNPKSLEELGRKFGSPENSGKSLADFIVYLKSHQYMKDKKIISDISKSNSNIIDNINNLSSSYLENIINYTQFPIISVHQDKVIIQQNKVFWIPHLKNTDFVDRPIVFEKLDCIIKKSKEGIACNPISLCGLGGMGKTEIAIEYCYRNQAYYQYIIWVRADTEATIQESFSEAAQALHLSIPTGASHNTYVHEVIEYLQSHDNWLLVVDNADGCSLGDENNSSHLINYFPRIGQGAILVTTRGDFIGKKELVVDLDKMKMDDETSLKLLLRNKTIFGDISCALTIVRELGYLPLAIDLAGACMEVENLTPIEFFEKYKNDPASYLDCKEIQERTGSLYGKTVLTVWNVSFESLKRRNPQAASLLESLAFLYPDDIPFALFQKYSKTIFTLNTAISLKELKDIIQYLGRFSFVQQIHWNAIDSDHPAKMTLSIHRLVQTVILLQMEPTVKLQYCECFISALNQEVSYSFQHSEKHFERTMEVYTPHIKHVVLQFVQGAAEKELQNISAILTSLLLPSVAYLTRHALFEGVEYLGKLAISSSIMRNGRKHPNTATALSNLSYFYTSQQNFKAAEPHSKETLEIRKEIFGMNDDNTIASLNNLLYIYKVLGMEKEATLLYLDAAKAGNHIAQEELARRYQEGIGISKDDDSAYFWMLKCENSELPRPRKQRKLDNTYSSDRIDLTPLHHAVREHDISNIRERAECYKLHANVGDKNGCTPLHLASRDGHVEIVRLLLTEFGANVNAKDSYGRTPLYEAAANGHVELIKLFAEFHINVNAQDMDGRTPLHGAVSSNCIEVVKLLTGGLGADVNARTMDGRAPLHEAVINRHIEMVKLLANKFDADVNANTETGRTPLHEAAARGWIDIVNLLANDLGADVNTKTLFGRTPLHTAAENGHVDMVELLAAKFGIDVNVETKDNRTPLLLAAENRQYKVVRWLVTKFRADTNAKTKNGLTLLHFLAQGGDFETTMQLLTEFDANANVRTKDGRTPLHLAAANGHVDVLKLLSTFGADINAKTDYGQTPLHNAAENGHIEVINLCVSEYGADINAKTNDDRTPLQLAAENGHIEIVRLLVTSFQADAKTETKEGQTVLHYLAADGHVDTVKWLVTNFGVNANAKNKEGRTPYHEAAGNGHIDMIKALQNEFGLDVNEKMENGRTPLHEAARNGHVETVRLLVADFRANVNAEASDGQTPLHDAAERGHVKVMKMLLTEFGANSNSKTNNGRTPLHEAAKHGHLEAACLLVTEFGACVNAKTDDRLIPLHEASRGGYVDIVRLFATQFEVNAKNKDGWTPLHWAADNGHVEVVRLLVDFLADVNAENNDGGTPLHNAARGGYANVVELLTNFDADVDAEDNDRWTPLHWAVSCGHAEVVRLLVAEFRAYPNTKDDEGWTPLHYAVEKEHIAIVRLLVTELEADVNAKDDDGWTPLHRAADNGNVEAFRLLVTELGADDKAKNNNGHTPWRYLAPAEQVKLVRLLDPKLSADANIIKNGEWMLLPKLSADANIIKNGEWMLLNWAAKNGHVEIVRLLVVESGVAPNVKDNTGQTPLHQAAQNGHIDIVILLMSEIKENLNVTDNDGWTALHWAAQNGYADIVKLLITDHRVDSNVNDNDGWTALRWAAKNGHIDIVELLMANPGADPNTKDDKGLTLLHEAARSGHVDIVRLLMFELGADVNAKDNCGWTLFHWAVEKRHVEIVKLCLVEFRAGINAKDNDGWTPLRRAIKNGYMQIVELLMDAVQLNLSCNSIGDEGACALGESLKQNTTLTQLNLSNNSIGIEGARALGESLKQNTTLTQLNLYNNRIGDEGACALGESLKQNTTLTQLNLYRNQIGAEGARALGESLADNTGVNFNF